MLNDSLENYINENGITIENDSILEEENPEEETIIEME